MSSVDEASAALEMCKGDSPLPCILAGSNVGLAKWTSQYCEARQPLSVLKRVTADIVNAYDIEEREEKEKRKRAREPDEEGWITVTRKRRSTMTQSQVKVH